MIQFLLAVFGLTSLWLAYSSNPARRKWSPIAGLLGQPAWLYFAWQAQGWGLMCLCTAYTLVYIQGIRVQWGRA